MTRLALNLAGRPFVNERPLKVLLGLVSALLLVVTFSNTYMLFQALAESRAVRVQLAAIRAETEIARAERATLVQSYTDKQKKLVRTVTANTAAIIQTRALSWTRLFDQLEAVLPHEVRVLTVFPEVSGNRMGLLMDCVARNDEAKRSFYVKLHEPPFSEAFLMGEIRDHGMIRFNVRCRYDPGGPEAVPLVELADWQKELARMGSSVDGSAPRPEAAGEAAPSWEPEAGDSTPGEPPGGMAPPEAGAVPGGQP